MRRTAFDVRVGDIDDLAVAMITDAIEACPHGGANRLHGIIGRVLHMSVDGVFSFHDTWEGTFFNGTPMKTAPPCIDNQRLPVAVRFGDKKNSASDV